MAHSDHSKIQRHTKTRGREARVRQEFRRATTLAEYDSLPSRLSSKAMRTRVI